MTGIVPHEYIKRLQVQHEAWVDAGCPRPCRRWFLTRLLRFFGWRQRFKFTPEQIAMIVGENEIMEDMLYAESKEPKRTFSVRTSLPTQVWRKP